MGLSALGFHESCSIVSALRNSLAFLLDSMFGVVEGFAVAGAVAALVSGYRDAADMFRRWRTKRRKAKQERLEASLELAPRKVKQEYESGFCHHGHLFAQGDGKPP